MNNQKTSNSPLDTALLLRLAVAGYLVYLLIKVIRGYVSGGADAPSLLVLLIAILVLGGGAVVIALISYLSWKKTKNAEQVLPEAEQEALPEETE